MGVFWHGLWCGPSCVGCLWCLWLGFGFGLLMGRVWLRGRPACPPPFPVLACGVGVCAGPGSRLCPAPLCWVVGVFFLRFFFVSLCRALWSLFPHPPSFGLGCGLFFFFFFSLFATPRHSWLGFAAGGGGRSPPLLARVRWRRWCVVCGVWCVAVVCWWGCGWCVVWLVPRHSWRRFLCATPRHSWLGFAAGGGGRSPPLLAGVRWRRWCVVCGGGVLVGLWLVCGVVGPSPLLAEVPVCYSTATPSWVSLPVVVGGPRHSWLGSAVGGGVWCVVVVCWWGRGWCVSWLVSRHSWWRFLCATPRHSWLGFAAGGGGRSPPFLAGVRWWRWCVVCGVWWWCVVGVVPKALLPKGKGRDVYPRVQVNGLGCVCCVRAVCKCVVA